ncbi:MAG: glycosyltransferase family 1 protein [Patescibacteria group bacterium]
MANIVKVGINSRIYQQENTGIPYYIKCLYDNLVKSQNDLSFVFFQTDGSKRIGDTKVIKVFKNLLGTLLFDIFFVNKLIRKEQINIFHGPAHILPFFKRENVKYVLTVHDLAFLIYPKHYNKIFNFYYKYFLKRSLRIADIIISVSESTKKDIIKFYKIPDNKIKVVYSGINSIFLNKIRKERIVKENYFFSITTSPKRKNIISVLEVMSNNAELKKYKYLIAGLIDENQLAELRDVIERLGLINDVILWGYANEDQLINFYENAEFFIYPSFYEGFGFPVLEAMACECPVITSCNSSLIEITPNKNWLVDPRSLKDISDKMINMIKLGERERDELISSNYSFSKQFSWDKTAEAYIKVFRDLL